jgi:diguanylate cyclase (GGDEF)-like protein
MNESQLYPIALLPLYRIRPRYLLWIIGGLTAVLTVGGYLIAPPADVWDGVTNRVFSLLVIAVTVVGMSKMADYEHKMFINSVTDPLTGLLNRRYFNELSEKETTRARRHRLSFAVLMLDIDHFKRINDTFGHPVGDLVIKTLAQVCNKALRPNDILARYGGEEFILTLPHTDEEGARVVAERIRQATQEIELAAPNDQVRFTVSIGISIYTEDLPFERLVGRADEALYKAKEGGRNRVITFPFGNGVVRA